MGDQSSITILNVDDNPSGRYVTTRVLMANGFAVREAANGAEALALAAERPDLVILDVNLPDISGIEVCRRIKTDPRTADVVVLQLSATAVGLEQRLQGLEGGADAYLVQPVDPLELVANIRALLRLRQAEDRVRAAAQEWNTTFHAIRDGLLVLDAQGSITRVNAALAHWLGQTEAGLVGRPVLEALPALEALAGQPGKAEPAPGAHPLQALYEASHDLEMSGRWCRLTVHPIWGNAGVLLGVVCVLVDITERKQVEEERERLYAAEQQARTLLETRVLQRTAQLQDSNLSLAREIAQHEQTEAELQRSHQQLRRLGKHLQDVREEERARISREIHDELGGALTGLKMELARLRRGVQEGGEPGAQTERFTHMAASLDQTLQTVRRIASDLRPAVLDDFGLTAAIEWQLQEFATHSGIACHFVPPEENVPLESSNATALFRIFQETLTNVARHAEASRVDVLLENAPGQLLLEVRDNGRGIEPQQTGNTRSLGLLGMRERVRLMAGELDITGQPGQGTTVRVRVPLEAAG